MLLQNLNYGAILAAAALYNLISMAWYSPRVLGRPWMKLVGIKPGPQKGRPPFWVGLVSSLVLSFTLAWILEYAQTYTFGESMAVATAIAWGIQAASTAPQTAFSGRPWGLYFIDAGAMVLTTYAMTTLLYFWR